LTFVDGGLVANNPSLIAYEEALRIWGDRPINCILSVGTGKTLPDKKPSVMDLMMNLVPGQLSKIVDLGKILLQTIDIATSSETTHLEMTSLTPSLGTAYWRLNPVLEEAIDLADASPRAMALMEKAATEFMAERRESLLHLVSQLTKPR
jgi:calcium-independent phospholipase A2-gamma